MPGSELNLLRGLLLTTDLGQGSPPEGGVASERGDWLVPLSGWPGQRAGGRQRQRRSCKTSCGVVGVEVLTLPGV